MLIDLTGRRALVCGSSQGIGRAIAIRFAQSGASITLLSRDENSLKEVLGELRAISAHAHDYLVADFSEPEQLRSVIEAYSQKQMVDILVNNTGGPRAGAIADATTDEFLNAYRQHLICNHILAQACMKGMKEKGSGRVINIISTSVKQPIRGLGVSNTTRAAVANWAKTLSIELAPYGITVNNILPGATKTQRLENIVKSKAAQSGEGAAQVEQEMLHEIPAGRFASAEEIANAAAFLASDFAAYINGVNLPVDGGRTACL